MLPDLLKKLFGRSPRTSRSEFRTLIDWDAFDTMLERSPVPPIFVMVLVCAVSTAALFFSGQHQRDPKNWQLGEKVPYTIYAQKDFTYIDRAATDSAKEKAYSETPEVYCIDPARSKEISNNFSDFMEYVKLRLDDRKAKRLRSVVKDSTPAIVAEEIPLSLCEAIVREYHRGTTYAKFSRQLKKKVDFGILGSGCSISSSYQRGVGKTKGKEKGYGEEKTKPSPVIVNVVDGKRKIPRRLDAFSSPMGLAELLANDLFPDDETCRDQFCKAALKLIGEEGNAYRDDDRTTHDRDKARDKIEVKVIHKKKNDRLVAKNDIFTAEMREMIEAADLSPVDHEMVVMIVWSLLLLFAAIALQYWLNPRCLGDNRAIIAIGLTIAIAIVLNYLSIFLFEHLLAIKKLDFRNLAVAAVPVALAPAMIAVMFDRRTAIGAGIYIASITAMMIMPERSFELMLRWSAVTTVTAFLVSRVNNYRSFFLHTLGISIVMTSLICLGLGREQGDILNFVKETVLVILCSGFAAAVLSLLLIFFFEVIGNQSTSMSMMVLCDCNHPLLERMKREAPGTMAHSMAVATLSEDAARAIGANALTAKAGALFHDIGKLMMPQYFTENNPDSALQHLNLNPQMSSIIIRDHVTEGLQMARHCRLCREVRDIIGTHHGDDLVRYFYNKMLENAKQDGSAPPVLESQFRYNGEPPRSIEATIVSLADACEAASRSLEHPTPERIRELVDRIILGRFQGGQLRRSLLPLADLEKVRESFVATLSSAHHGRVSYDAPTQTEGKEAQDETALPVAEPASSESRQK